MILIAGAGPAGSLCAMLLGKENDVLLVEEHQSAGFPMQCAGLISDRCFEGYKRYCRIKKAVENEIYGALFFSPSGKFFQARGKAYVIERKMLDEMLLEKASDFANVFLKSKVKFKGRKAFFGGRCLQADYVIGADGVNSEVAKAFSFERPGFFTAVQVEAKFEAIDEKFVEIYLGKAYSDFFAYAIPLGDTARLGVIAKENALEKLQNLVRKHPSVSKRFRGSFIEINSGIIPSRLVSFVKERVALIGDSAGMVKPHTGGGLYYLLFAAEKLAESFPNLKKYEKAFLNELGKEIRVGYRIRRIYSLEDRELEKLVGALRDFDFSGVHMDRPSTFFSSAVFFRSVKLLLKEPLLLRIVWKLL